MIFNILIIMQAQVESIHSNLDDLAAPATIFDAFYRADIERYNQLIKKTNLITCSYAALDAKSKHKLIRAWYNSAKCKQDLLKVKYNSGDGLIWCDYKVRDQIDKYEFTKIDVLRIIDNKETFFNSSSRLRDLYRAHDTSSFRCIGLTETEFRRSRSLLENFSFGDGFYAFQPRLAADQMRFVSWIEGLRD
jgi:hypothetical protein